MSWYHPRTLLDKIFEGSILLKGISGVLEFIGGLLILFVNPDSLHRFLVVLTQNALTHDPHSTIANLILHSAEHLNTANKAFAVAYLWVHAVIKLVAVIGLLRNKLWAYPFSLVTLGLFMVYQMVSIVVRPTFGMIFLTVFDAFVLWLIYREYLKNRSSLIKDQEGTGDRL